eukprot:Skav235826  [mRNA]  locus=scaffold1931:79451:81824:- [translate_table: standard]
MLLVAPMVQVPMHELEPPRLLGRTSSPAPPPAPGTEPAKTTELPSHQEPMPPGTLEHSSTPSGGERIRWCVDGQKLESHSEKLISPEFRLTRPRGGQRQRRRVIRALPHHAVGHTDWRQAWRRL